MIIIKFFLYLFLHLRCREVSERERDTRCGKYMCVGQRPHGLSNVVCCWPIYEHLRLYIETIENIYMMIVINGNLLQTHTHNM